VDDKAQTMMQRLTRHLTRSLLAGLVALLPLGGFAFTVIYLEKSLAASWMAAQRWYFPGLGLLAAAVALYVVGLTVTTVVGRWAWNRIDALLDSVPALGSLYQTFKQILGYGTSKDAVFQSVVMIPAESGSEIGLVTNEINTPGEPKRYVVFVPESPNPTAGRLLLIEASRVVPIPASVSDTMKTLISAGKSPLPWPTARRQP